MLTHGKTKHFLICETSVKVTACNVLYLSHTETQQFFFIVLK